MQVRRLNTIARFACGKEMPGISLDGLNDIIVYINAEENIQKNFQRGF